MPKYTHWEILSNNKGKTSSRQVVDTLLRNRGITTKKDRDDFFNPIPPNEFTLKALGIKSTEVKKAISRVKKAIKGKEKIIIYGDYDADGICATAIIWEALWSLGADVMPYLPDRFEDGYGFNENVIKKLRKADPTLSLVITVDNGITANKKINSVKKLVDVIVTDHHQVGRSVPKATAVVHTTKLSGSAVAWVLAKEIKKTFGKKDYSNGLDLVAIGTIADQIPVVGIPRSFIMHGLKELNRTKRPGLQQIIKSASLDNKKIGVYEVGFIIAPRLNAMGRLQHAIDSLRIICTNDSQKAKQLAKTLDKVNSTRQDIVQKIVKHASKAAADQKNKVLVIAHKTYHEGVIGLAASKLVEEYYRPSIVFCIKGDIAKASARSIPGFDIISAIRSTGSILLEAGGHTMAAGFSIKSTHIGKFTKMINKYSDPLLSTEVLEKKLRIDLQIDLNNISQELVNTIGKFTPFGIGNPEPVFTTNEISPKYLRTIGSTSSHLKFLACQSNSRNTCNAIGFGMGEIAALLPSDPLFNIAFNIRENFWNGKTTIDLHLKDIKLN